ncbi:MAG: aliphatic sulfonate ABC transporter substrate-binding protein [Microbacteriaceae bacterium]
MPRTRLHRLAALTVAATLIAGLTACTGSSSSDDDSTTTLRLGQLGQSKIIEALLEASGEDQDMDYTVEWSLFDAGPALLEAVPSGSIDGGMMADTPPIFGQVSDSATKIVAVAQSVASDTSQVEIVVPGDSDIESVADLAGKKVAMLQSTIMQYTLVKALENAGLDYEDITPVNLSPVDAATALAGGDVDAAAMLDPQRATALAAGDRVIGNGAGLVADYTVTVATDAALEDSAKSAALEDFIGRVQAAYDWAAANQDTWAAAYATVTGLSEDIASAVVERQDYNLVPIDDSVIANQQDQADTYYDLGLLTEKLDVSAEFDDRFNSVAEAQ